MERAMSVEDKIRRAEEIYNRKHEKEYRVTNTRVSVENKEKATNQNVNKKLKKMIIQIIICMVIYLSFHYTITNDYVFSQDFKAKCEEILAYDISFTEMYQNISNYISMIQEKYQSTIENEKIEETQEENITEEQEHSEEETQESQNEESETENTEDIQENIETSVEENIGGPLEETINAEVVGETDSEEEIKVSFESEDTGESEKLSEEEQMKKDAEEIKANINFIKPLTGVITSVFGWRNPKSSTVSKYHTGIDIAANQGTDIISATNGKVKLASSKGAYGNHLKIEIGDVTLIYAHCLSLEVKEGDEIKQGQVIAKVGSTGNSTGPHLHFEIRKEDRYVDPSLILDF